MSGKKIVEIARSQLDKDNKDCGCYAAPGQKWCSEFVSWVYKEAGQPFSGGGKPDWLLKDTTAIRNWFLAKGNWIDRNDLDWDSFVPSPGDYVFIGRWSKPKREHSGLVERVSGNDLHTIEGNNKRRPVARYVYPAFRTNFKSDLPPETDGYVRAFGAKSERRLRNPSPASSARLQFAVLIQKVFTRRFSPDLVLVRLLLKQLASGLKYIARDAMARGHLSNAIQNAAANHQTHDLGVIALVLQQIAAGLSSDARTGPAKAQFDAAAAHAFARQFTPDLDLHRAVLHRIATGLRLTSRNVPAKVYFETAVHTASPSSQPNLYAIVLMVQLLAAGLSENLSPGPH
jgi:hypothetical protein